MMDLAIAIFVLCSLVLGIFRGAIREVFHFIGLIFTWLLSNLSFSYVHKITGWSFGTRQWGSVVWFLVIFVLGIVVAEIIDIYIYRVNTNKNKLSTKNKICGGAIASTRVICVLLFCIHFTFLIPTKQISPPLRKQIEKSKIINQIHSVSLQEFIGHSHLGQYLKSIR